MSFYDLTKDSVLSPTELFKYRAAKRECTIPTRGGQKDFEPDGSWIQDKALQVFMQERTKVLAEPRVEKLKSLVEGVWDKEKGLVNVSKTGKFWAHMGFTDDRRHWLYPEEALYLMEINTLEVKDNGVALSIQEAYKKFLGSDVTVDEYQVFSYLRRLGYVVLRHEEQPFITPYMKKINLDKYVDKKQLNQKKRKLKNKEKQQNGKGDEKSDKRIKISDSALVSDSGVIPVDKSLDEEEKSNGRNVEHSVGVSERVEADKSTGRLSGDEECNKNGNENPSTTPSGGETSPSSSANTSAAPLINTSSTEASHSHSQFRGFYTNPWTEFFLLSSKKSQQELSQVSGHVNGEDSSDVSSGTIDKKDNSDIASDSLGRKDISDGPSCSKDEKDISDGIAQEDTGLNLPNIANKDSILLSIPHPKLLPADVSLGEDALSFDVGRYRHLYPPRQITRAETREEEMQTRVQGLKFSFPEHMANKTHIQATNWKDYKAKLANKDHKNSNPVAHYWEGEITPLVHPSDAWSSQSILDHLRIIESADNTSLIPDSDCMIDIKISYDVHLPDSRFKKSMPGIPNHRVCVTKCSSQLPGLAEIQQVWARLKDEVPLHWAVVDSGEIAFYVFDNSHRLETLS
ncbi:uncharacterized protein LOC131949319 [Physella acuta]|uniref:uncharacterized protein LOC131949319 n=1 Tax=Physella acuta TaxID=109671 RepID=UPI0027DD86B7|nr:uncharacterized protein LOC131949319 [Physella acuta]